MIPKRIELKQLKGLPSSYKRKYRPKERIDVEKFGEASHICPDMIEALVKLEELVRLNSGQFYITDLYRSWETQAKARKDYESGKKRAFVAKPGSSMHNAARAVDFSVKELNFENMPQDDWLKFFWDLARPLGFHPIIKIPDLNASEAWHLDYPGKDWESAYENLSYSEVAKCCILDIGKYPGSDTVVTKMFIQAQVHRLGYHEVGFVDGIFGPKTNKFLEFLNVKDFDLNLQAEMLAKR